MATLLVPSRLYSTIAEAMAAAQPGDTIEVAAGYGPEVVTVTALRANKRETIDWLKFTLEGAGERTHGYAFTDTTFAG